jgi:hypothetical protein
VPVLDQVNAQLKADGMEKVTISIDTLRRAIGRK